VEYEAEIVEGELVEVRAAELERPRLLAPDTIRTATAAATGFLVGAAALTLAQRLGARRLQRVGQPWPTGQATYVVTVRTLQRPSP
jgi:hypothetical protein